MANLVENINVDILRQCREQIGLSLTNVEKKIKKIDAIENGEKKPTFKQLDTLAEIYKVPRWVFISDSLPEKYQFEKTVPAFRQFINSNPEIFSDYKVRGLLAKVESFRDLILELSGEMDELIAEFSPPSLPVDASTEIVAEIIRNWLNVKEPLEFSEWKNRLEEKNVFVFMTSKFKDWSYIDKALLRGLAIYYSRLPIIIINDSDSKKAQSFTLFHEMGHLLKHETAIDGWSSYQKQIEKWCDDFSGNILMPRQDFRFSRSEIADLEDVKNIAKNFKISPYACLVRLKQLSIISQAIYKSFETELVEEYKALQKQLQANEGGPARNRSRELLNQYGRIYTKILFQAYHNQEIGLNKLSRLFGLKNASSVLQLEGRL
jgi:Zn-dependent peptidase ImmA (M78 family)